jgi:O-antigen/teichoic acid export membrane protein
MKLSKSNLWLNIYHSAINFAKTPLFYNAWYLLGINLFPAFVGFLFWTFASKLYTTNEVGLASVIISAASFISWMAGLGTNIGLIRFLPGAVDPRRMINSVLNLNLILSALCGGVFLLGIPLWAAHVGPVLNDVFLSAVFLIFVAASTLGTSIRDCFVAYRQSNYAFLYTLTSNLLRVLLLFAGLHFGATGLVGSVAFSFLLAYLTCTFILFPRVSPGFGRSFQMDWSDLKSLLPFSGSNYLAMLILQMTQTIIPLLTFELLGAQANAYSYIALMLGTLSTGPGIALSMSAFAEGSNNYEQSHKILSRALYLSLPITIVCSAILAIGAPWFLAWFGEDYARAGSDLLRWLSFAGPFIIVSQLYFTYLRLQKKNALLVFWNCILMASTLVIAYLLMPMIGILANAFGILAGNLVVAFWAFFDWLKNNRQKRTEP